MKSLLLFCFAIFTLTYGEHRHIDHTYWNGIFNDVEMEFYLPLMRYYTNGFGEVYYVFVTFSAQNDTPPHQMSSYADNTSCYPLDDNATCVYSSPNSHGYLNDPNTKLSQIKLVFDTFQYVNATTNGFLVSLDVHCSKSQARKFRNLGIPKNFTTDKYTTIIASTTKCKKKPHRIVKSFGITFKDGKGKEYPCGNTKPVCDPKGLLAQKKCERVNNFLPVFIDLVKDCGVPQDKLIAPVF